MNACNPDLARQPASANPAARGEWTRNEVVRRQEQLLNEALEETFPASNPVSVVRVA
jgi:hypothetical protein